MSNSSELDIYQFDTNVPGPHLLIFGSIHGNEPAGRLALPEIIEKLNEGTLSLQKGSLTLVPVCNPKATAQNTRFYDFDLNRQFGNPKPEKGYESELAKQLIPFIQDCDYLLDIHSTHVPGDPAFVFVEEQSGPIFDFAGALNIPNIFLGWGDVYEGEDYSTEAYAVSKGKKALTLECGYHNDESAKTIARQAIYNALAYTGLIEHKDNPYHNDPQQGAELYRFVKAVYRAEGDIFLNNWKHMDPIPQGTVIYQNAAGEQIKSKEDGYILIPNANSKPGHEFFYYGIKESA